MIDIWRIQHQTVKNYSYYSNIHYTYQRIDYFLVSQIGLMMMPSSNIGNFLWSDHAPVFLELAATQGRKPLGAWRLNDNLLKDDKCEKEIRQRVKEFLQIHEIDNTSIPIQWETLKCVLWRLFIKHGTRLKKEKEHTIMQLQGEISVLENMHKQNLNPEDEIKLNHKLTELQTMLDEQYLQLRDRNRALFYQHGNKPGKVLARNIKQQKPMTPINKIQKMSGEITYDPGEIAKTSSIQQESEGRKDNLEEIRQYMGETAIPTLS